MQEFSNRLAKLKSKKEKWAKREQVTCYRWYEKDLPNFPFIIDCYLDYIVIYDLTDDRDPKGLCSQVLELLTEDFGITPENIYLKKRQRQKGEDQYEKLEQTQKKIIVSELGSKIIVNLSDYLDTGLFLDHRPMRAYLQKNLKGKSLLNLFSYTGVVGLQAAMGGAHTTNVDLSKTYINWATENFLLNKLSLKDHHFIVSDVKKFLEETGEEYDCIFLDPPTFSNSKKIDWTLDIQRDAHELIELALKHLRRNGVLYFSTNKKGFKLPELSEVLVKDISEKTIPFDFHNKKIHQCYEIRLS